MELLDKLNGGTQQKAMNGEKVPQKRSITFLEAARLATNIKVVTTFEYLWLPIRSQRKN